MKFTTLVRRPYKTKLIYETFYTNSTAIYHDDRHHSSYSANDLVAFLELTLDEGDASLSPTATYCTASILFFIPTETDFSYFSLLFFIFLFYLTGEAYCVLRIKLVMFI